MLSCHGGSAVPVHLAAHVHPGSATVHDRHRLYANPLHSRAAVQLSVPSQRAAARGGETPRMCTIIHNFCSMSVRVVFKTFWFINIYIYIYIYIYIHIYSILQNTHTHTYIYILQNVLSVQYVLYTAFFFNSNCDSMQQGCNTLHFYM